MNKLLKCIFLLLTFLLSTISAFAQENRQTNSDLSVLKGPYLGQKPPGITPEIFAPYILSSGVHELDITISPDLNEILFSRAGFDYYTAIIKISRVNGIWGNHETLDFTENMSCNYPFITQDGSMLVFDSRGLIVNKTMQKNDSNIWYSKRENNKWTKPQSFSSVINTNTVEMFPSVAANRNLYFSANYEDGIGMFDIYVSRFIDGEYTKPENLGANINTSFSEFHAFVAHDESFIIFDSNREGGFGRNDLFISYKNSEGTWTPSINMGDAINTDSSDMRPYVSPDGKYLFFCSDRPHSSVSENLWEYDNFMKRINGPGNSSQDIYWIDAKIIENLRPISIK